MTGFKKFLVRGNLVELAVAVVIGAAFSGLVDALVSDIITPLIGAVTGGHEPDFADYSFKINGAEFKYGDFVNHAVSFLIVAAVIYWLVVLPMARLLSLLTRDKAATEKQCPECLSDIPVAARRCAFCTAVLVAPAGSPASMTAHAPGRHSA
ncbi:large-conductance mechanosensitive channel [Planotetraspora thailandica]|uniref:Large-conductance mechanosensitive channel n=1 Tax=Planotetraspora thailandica TaxID=487172 RepID=A0A8J3V2B4_9ACTN|nr:large conductance mechanosensitive channel protein MscL [Planotetraspora thailandica]GII56439.1 large-conductance mechanosensitive channel [Planotetraspora thailandica]